MTFDGHCFKHCTEAAEKCVCFSPQTWLIVRFDQNWRNYFWQEIQFCIGASYWVHILNDVTPMFNICQGIMLLFWKGLLAHAPRRILITIPFIFLQGNTQNVYSEHRVGNWSTSQFVELQPIELCPLRIQRFTVLDEFLRNTSFNFTVITVT